MHYISLPSLGWDAVLKDAQTEIELVTSEEKYKFFEGSTRGGVTCANRTVSVANNPGCKNYDPTKPTTWMIYLDANSLYPHVMRRPLPYSNLTWVPEHQLEIPLDEADQTGWSGRISC